MIALDLATCDACLVRRFRAGDERAFDVMHARYRTPLERHAARLLQDRQPGPEDVVQETFVRAYRALRRDDRVLQLGPWLHRIVRNQCFDELRRGYAVPVNDLAFAAVAGGVDPAVSLMVREQLTAITDAYAGLPARQRRAIAGQLNGEAHTVLAAELGISAGASKNLLHRARGTLRAAALEAV